MSATQRMASHGAGWRLRAMGDGAGGLGGNEADVVTAAMPSGQGPTISTHRLMADA